MNMIYALCLLNMAFLLLLEYALLTQGRYEDAVQKREATPIPFRTETSSRRTFR